MRPRQGAVNSSVCGYFCAPDLCRLPPRTRGGPIRGQHPHVSFRFALSFSIVFDPFLFNSIAFGKTLIFHRATSEIVFHNLLQQQPLAAGNPLPRACSPPPTSYTTMSSAAFVSPLVPLARHRSNCDVFRTSPPRRLPRHRLRPKLCTPPPDSPDSTPAQSTPSTSSTPTPSPSDLSFSTAASSAPTLSGALAEAASRALANLSPGGPPSLAIVFVSARYCVSKVGPSGRDSMDLVVPKLRALVPELSAVVGCTADGVIGLGPTDDVVELEDGPGVSLTLARLPRIHIKTFHVMPDDIPSLDASQAAWQRLLGNPHLGNGAHPPAFLIFSDPSFAERGELDRFLSGLEYAYPGSAVVGSLASTAAAIAQGHLYCTLPRDVLSADSTSLRDSGLVGISLTGDVQLDCLVSPGCRPIGPVFEVRKVVDGNVVSEMELVGRPSSSLSAVGHLKSLISYATPSEKRLIQNELHVGIAVDKISEGQDDVDDYLIRHVIGVDMSGGGIAVAQKIRPGQRVRFFVKEVDTALKTLDATMQKYKRVELANSLVGYSNPPFGALVFVDSLRGRALFREPAMETRNLTSFAPGVPVTGFFGGGQIGPCHSGEDGLNTPSVLHNAANLIALVRRRSGMTPLEPIDSPTTSNADLDDETKK